MQSIGTLALTVTAAGAVAYARAVGFDGAQASVAGQKVLGVARYAVADGAAGAIDVAGTAIVETGAAVAVGDSLIVDAQGRAVPSSGDLQVDAGAVAVLSAAANGAVLTGAELPEYVFADALQAADAAGELIEVLFRR